jgi:hypothetical protein
MSQIYVFECQIISSSTGQMFIQFDLNKCQIIIIIINRFQMTVN